MKSQISIIIAAFNSEKYIRYALDSILSQPMDPTYEIIVVNDGSTDSTRSILDMYTGQIKIINQNNQGAAAARNRAWRECNGQYILIMDSDDALPPNAFLSRFKYLDCHPEVDLVYGDVRYINTNNTPIGMVKLKYKSGPNHWVYPYYLISNIFPVNSALTRRKVFEDIGILHDETLDYICDWDLWARVSVKHKMAFIPGLVAEYRIHDNMSLRKLTRKRGLTQTYNTLGRVFNNPCFSEVKRNIKIKALINYALYGARLGKWEEVRSIVSKGFELSKYDPVLIFLYFVSGHSLITSPVRKYIERWGA